MMLHQRDENFVARSDARARKTLGDEIDRLGRAPREHDLLAGNCIDKPPHIFAGTLVGFSSTLAQGVNTTVDIGVIVLVVIDKCLHDLSWTLC